MSWLKLQRKIAPYLFIAPFFIGYAIFWGYPVISGFWSSLHGEKFGPGGDRWIGFDNYRKLIDDERFLHAVRNTFVYAGGSVFIIIPVALVIALCLNADWLRFRGGFRFAFLLPNVVSAAVIAIMFVLVFDRNYGVLNSYVLEPVGIKPINWLGSPRWSMPSLILLGLWRYAGINSLYFLVGLHNIPKEINEAAALDGAGKWRTFRDVTLPQLRPVTLFVVTIAIIGSFKLFAEPRILFGGPGPSDAALTVMSYLYLVGFESVRFGYAAAVGYSLVLIIAVLAFLQLKIFGAFRED
ncbi:MAG: carbohydrate ABC transporter permease [Thermomicrobiales bacterium]